MPDPNDNYHAPKSEALVAFIKELFDAQDEWDAFLKVACTRDHFEDWKEAGKPQHYTITPKQEPEKGTE